MGKQSKQEIHYLHLSEIGGWKKRWGKEKRIDIALPASS